MAFDLSVVIPVFNEEHVLPLLLGEVLEGSNLCTERFEIILVNDGSRDLTSEKLESICFEDRRVKVIELNKNYGHQAALLVGLSHAKGTYVLTMDADLQHPPSLIPDLYQEIIKGYDVVSGVRRVKDFYSAKVFLSALFYEIFNLLTDVKIVKGAADFRIVSQKVLNDLAQVKKRVLFFRAFVATKKYRVSYLKYDEEKRKHGRSKYSYSKMFDLAFVGLMSFSSLWVKFMFAIIVLLCPFILYVLSGYCLSREMNWSFYMLVPIFILYTYVLSHFCFYLYREARFYFRNKENPAYEIKRKIGHWV